MNSTIGGLSRGEMGLDQRQIIRVVPIDNRLAGCLPNARMRQDILERGADGSQSMRLAHPIRMQSDTHHAALVGPFSIDRIEIILDLLGERVRFLTASMQN